MPTPPGRGRPVASNATISAPQPSDLAHFPPRRRDVRFEARILALHDPDDRKIDPLADGFKILLAGGAHSDRSGFFRRDCDCR